LDPLLKTMDFLHMFLVNMWLTFPVGYMCADFLNHASFTLEM
jgi:hypothetical protein